MLTATGNLELHENMELVCHPSVPTFGCNALQLLATVASATVQSRAALQLENLALRHQLGVLRRSVKKPKLAAPDRLLWAWLCRVWRDWHAAVVIVKPATVMAWHRRGFRLFWRGKIRRGHPAHCS